MRKKIRYTIIIVVSIISLGSIAAVGFLAWRSRQKANLWESAQSLYEQRRFDQARQVLRQLLNSDPANENACRLLAEIAEQQRRYERAAFWWRRVMAFNALDPEPPVRCAEAMLNSGAPAQALELLAPLSERPNASPQLKLLWVEALAQGGNLLRARQAWQKLPAAQQNTSRGRIADAIMLLRERKQEEARRIFLAVLKAPSDADFHWQARIGLFNLALLNNQESEAEKELLEAEQQNSIRTAPILADFYLRINQIGKGIEYLQKLLDASPENIPVRIRLAELYTAQREIQPIVELRKSISPGNKAALEASYYLDAMILYLQKQYQDAARKLQLCPIFENQLVYALIRLISDIELNHADKWESDAQKLLQLADNTPARERLSNLLFPALEKISTVPAQQQYAVGVARFLQETLPPKSPLQPPLLRFLMLNALSENKLPQARNYAEELLFRIPDDANAFLTLGEIALQSGAPREALRYFGKLPRDRNSLLGRAIALEQLQQPDAAALFREAYQAYPDDVNVWNAYGNFLLRQRRFPELQTLLAHITAQTPDATYLQAMLRAAAAEAEQKPKEMATQREKAIAALQSMPASPERNYRLGMLYALLDQNESAEKYYQEVLLAEPTRVLALLNLSEVKAALGKHDEAIALAKQAKAIQPASPEVQKCWERRLSEKRK